MTATCLVALLLTATLLALVGFVVGLRRDAREAEAAYRERE